MNDDLMRPIYEMQQNHRANRGAAEEIDAIDQVAIHIEAQAVEITRLRAKVDAVYSERNRLSAAFARMALAAGFKAGKGVDPDETKWPVVYVETPNGQVSWHIAEADRGVLEGLPQYSGEWDGKFTTRDPAWLMWPVADLVTTAQREVTGWQSIETAPKDGTVILGYRLDSRGDWEVFVTQWEKLEHRVGEKYSWRLLHADHYGALVYEDRLTHWTSMPDLPKEEKP